MADEAAEAAKEEANALFKKGKYEEALVCYDKAIELDEEPKNAIYPANKAMVYLKMKRWEDAEHYCNLAIELDEKYSKVTVTMNLCLVSVLLFLLVS